MFACIYIPDFPVEAIVRAEPLLRERAVAVLEGKPPLTRVVALNEKARLLGMETGMTKLQAAIFAPRARISLTSQVLQTGIPGDLATTLARSRKTRLMPHCSMSLMLLRREWKIPLPTRCCSISAAWSGSMARPPQWAATWNRV